MRSVLVVSLAGSLLLGCKDDQRPDAPVEPVTEIQEDAAGPETPGNEEPDEAVVIEAEPSAAAGTTTPLAKSGEPTDPLELAPERDLGAELRAALGTPLDCIRDYRPAGPKTIRVDVRGVVRPTGMIIEPSAAGAGLSRNDVQCIEERIEAVVLAPLTGTGSRKVSTTLELEYTPPEVDSYEVAPPPPPAENVVPALPKKDPIAPSGQKIEGPAPKPVEGPSGRPIEGPEAVPIEGPKSVPIGSE